MQANPIIRGWAKYYRIAHTSPQVFGNIRYWLYRLYHDLVYLRKVRDKDSYKQIKERIDGEYFSKKGSYA